jgi:hypothetical protein
VFNEDIDEQFIGSRFATKWHSIYEIRDQFFKGVGKETPLDEFELAKINSGHQVSGEDFKQSSDVLPVLKQPSGNPVWEVSNRRVEKFDYFCCVCHSSLRFSNRF